MMRRTWLRSVVLAIAVVSLPAWSVAVAQSEQDNCGQDSVLVWPISRSGPLPDSEVVAYGLDGVERARFAIERPAFAEFSAVPGRALVLHHPEATSIVDVTTDTVTALEFNGGSRPVSFNEPEQGDAIPDDSSFALARGSYGQFYLVDLDTYRSSYLNSGNIGHSIYGVVISTGGEYIAVSSSDGIFLGRACDPDTLESVPAGAGFWTPVFVDDAGSLVFLTYDFSAEVGQLQRVETSTRQVSVIEDLPFGPSFPGLRRVGDRAVAYSGGQSIVVTDVGTTTSATYHIENPEPRIAAVSLDEQKLLYSTQAVGEEITQWFLLDMQTGESEYLKYLDGPVALEAVEPLRWTLFRGSHSQHTDFALADLETGESQLAFSVAEVYGTARLLAQAPDEASALFEIDYKAQKSIGLLDYPTGLLTKLSDIEGTSTAAYSPDGCFVAVGDYLPTPDLRTAEVRIHTLDGEIVFTIPVAILIGWAPAA